MRQELDTTRSDLETARSEQHATRSELNDARVDLDAANATLATTGADLAKVREELEATRDERDAVWADLERAQHEAEANRDAAERAAEAEGRLAEMGDLERRVVEAHSIAESMRNDFELEREGYAAAERELRAKLASESERHEALRDEHEALRERVENLGVQNTALLEAYTAAKDSSVELVRGARELALTLEQVVLDDAVFAPQPAEETEVAETEVAETEVVGEDQPDDGAERSSYEG